MKIYLSGPMRGLPQLNMPAFNRAAAALRALGHEVWNPAEHEKEGLGFQDYMRADLPALLDQDAIALLDGWSRSEGACVERHLADAVGMLVFMYEPRVEGSLMALARHDWRWRAP